MKLYLLVLGPAMATAQLNCDEYPYPGCVPTGFCAGAPAVGDPLTTSECDEVNVTSPCYDHDLFFVTDCQNSTNNLCTWVGDSYCDDGTGYSTDYNCADFDYDDGDCDTIFDCDGNLHLLSSLGNGRCDDGTYGEANFDCEAFNYDFGDCPATDCDGQCLDDYGSDDGSCQENFNCKKFKYSFGQCTRPNLECPDDWYDTGRANYRCKQEKDGPNRFASKQMVPFNECDCYEWCQGKAETKGVTLDAFDHYSDKCRCWEDCTDPELIPCKGQGENADAFLGTDGRCPSMVYFPHQPVVLDCHAGVFQQDVTMYENYFYEHYNDDGFCDNAQFGIDDWAEYDYGDDYIGDYDCAQFGNDGEDCKYATCDEIWDITRFATLDEPNMVCDGHNDEITKDTPWTTACECYEFCAPTRGDTGDNVMFQRNNEGMCQCLSDCESQTNCGLESDCQIFDVNRQFDCCGNDWTLGMNLDSEYIQNEANMMDFYTDYANSIQEKAYGPKVISLDYLKSIAQQRDFCVPAFMCLEQEWSFGEVDPSNDLPLSSPCFRCNVDSDEELESRSVNNTRCDMARNDGIRYFQEKNYYALSTGRDPLKVDDYCGCEVICRRDKFWDYYDEDECPVDAFVGYNAWQNDPETKFAVDAYKGDCRCWDYCVPNTTWECTAGRIDRCIEPVAVLFYSDNRGGFPSERKYEK